MDAELFDTLTRSLTTAGSRRRAMVATLGGALSLLGWQRMDDAAAHNAKSACKKKSGKKKKACLKKAKKHNATHTTAFPPDPVTTADAACSLSTSSILGGARLAQTFRAVRSGQLTSASVVLLLNAEGVTFDLEIWSVDAANKPSIALAGTTIANVPATPPGQSRTLSGTFGTPATVVAGLRYALVLTERPSKGYELQVNSDNPCPDGNVFHDRFADGTFTDHSQHDMVFTTFVTA